MSKPGIFISYRRSDTRWFAATLCTRINQRLPSLAVFLDVASIEPGLDFEDVLNITLDRAQVLLALIGRDWLTAHDQAGRRRLDLETDWVRAELTRALKRNIRVVPVLVDGAEMPSPEFLPSSLSSLSKRQTISVKFEENEVGIESILAILAKICDVSSIAAPQQATVLLPSTQPSATAVLEVFEEGSIDKETLTVPAAPQKASVPLSLTQPSATAVLGVFEEGSVDNETLTVLAEHQLDRGRFALARSIFEVVASRKFRRLNGPSDIDMLSDWYQIARANLLVGEFEAAARDLVSILPGIDRERDASHPLYIRAQAALARAHLERGDAESAQAVLPDKRGVTFRDQSLTAMDAWIAHLKGKQSSRDDLLMQLDKELKSNPPTVEFARSVTRLHETMQNSSLAPTMIWKPDGL